MCSIEPVMKCISVCPHIVSLSSGSRPVLAVFDVFSVDSKSGISTIDVIVIMHAIRECDWLYIIYIYNVRCMQLAFERNTW